MYNYFKGRFKQSSEFGGSLSRTALEIKHIFKNENLSDDMIGIFEKADRKLNMTQSHRIKSINVTW